MTDLDDFFAKKGKRKIIGRKYDNPDEIGKRLDQSEKKLERTQKIEQPSLDHEVDLPTLAKPQGVENKSKEEEEGWNDFKDEGEKDLTDLKITNLQIVDDDDGGYGGGSDDDGEGGGGGGGKSGAWKTNFDKEEKVVEVVEEVPVKQKGPSNRDDPHQKGSYKPPHLRNSSSMSASPLPKSSIRKPKVAPDISSEMAFPSLSNTDNVTPRGAWGKRKPSDDRGFENVKHGSTKSYAEDTQGQRLTTANRFDALGDS